MTLSLFLKFIYYIIRVQMLYSVDKLQKFSFKAVTLNYNVFFTAVTLLVFTFFEDTERTFFFSEDLVENIVHNTSGTL